MHGWVKANLNPESETTLREDLPKNVLFWAFPERKHCFLGEVIPNGESVCQNQNKFLMWSYTPKTQKGNQGSISLNESFSGIMWQYMLFRSSLIELGRNGFFDLNICLLSIEHISSLRSCWEKFEKTPGWLTDWLFCIICSHNLFLLGRCCTILSWSGLRFSWTGWQTRFGLNQNQNDDRP